MSHTTTPSMRFGFGMAMSRLSNGFPPTHYATSGDINIAYQIWGAAPIDLVIVAGIISHVEAFHKLPGYTSFFQQASRFARVTFDKRGQGLSDRISGAPTLEERIDDIRAVMDSAGSRRAALVGFSAGAAMSVMCAAAYPERVSHLIIFGSSAAGPAHRNPAYVERIAQRAASWGDGTFLKQVVSPHASISAQAMQNFGKLERLIMLPQPGRTISLFDAISPAPPRPTRA